MAMLNVVPYGVYISQLIKFSRVCSHVDDFNTHNIRERGGLVVNASDRIQRSGVRAPLGSNRVVSLSKAHLLPKSTGNTQEAVAPSQHD